MSSTASAALIDGTANGALEAAAAPVTGAPDTDDFVVKRSPLGDIKITLAAEDDMNKYTEVVDTGSGITGFTTKWMYKTLERDNGVKAMMDVAAEDATSKEEATVYTNIDKAEEGKWKLGGDAANDANCRATYRQKWRSWLMQAR